MEKIQLIWLGVLVVMLILEGVTVAMVSIWFCAGALVAFLVSLLWPEMLIVQIIAFLVVSTITLLLLRPVLKRSIDRNKVPTNADANIGKNGQVVAEIQPGRFGRVNLEGQEWTAKSDYILPVGSWCRVEAIEGVKLVVIPLAG